MYWGRGVIQKSAPGWARTTNLSVNSRTRQPIAPRRLTCLKQLIFEFISPFGQVKHLIFKILHHKTITVRYGLVVRISGSHPGGPGSIPGNGISIFFLLFLLTLNTKKRQFARLQCLRPYHVEHTSSRLITEVKQHWVKLVLGWVTAWEYLMLQVTF